MRHVEPRKQNAIMRAFAKGSRIPEIVFGQRKRRGESDRMDVSCADKQNRRMTLNDPLVPLSDA
jgi:hypothetical protein